MAVSGLSYDGVFFDLHGTLTVPLRSTGVATGATLIDGIGRLGIDVSELSADTVNDELWQEPAVIEAASGTPFEYRLAGFVNRRFGTSLGPSDFRAAADAVCARWQSGFRPDPDCRSVLSTIAASVPVGLVSNFDHPPHVRRLLAELDLASVFATIVISGEEGVQKPDPAILLIACRNTGVRPQRCAYIGDSYTDYRAASAAGMSFVWLRRPEIQVWISEQTGGRFQETDAELVRRGKHGEIRVIESLTELTAPA